MPDPPDPKIRAHPRKQTFARRESPPPRGQARYAELAATSNFTFLTGASHPDELVTQAAELGYEAIAVADHNSLAGIVRAHVAAKAAGIPLVVGSRLVFSDVDPHVLVYPTDRRAYGRLCTLLTLGRRRAEKGHCELALDDLLACQEGLLAVALAGESVNAANDALLRLRDVFDDDRLSLAITRLYGQADEARADALRRLSRETGVPLVAVNDVYYHVPARRALQDVVTCIRHGCTLDEAGFRLFPNGERYLKPPAEMARLFARDPQAVARTVEIAARTRAFNLDALRYEYPHELCPPGLTQMEHLRRLTWDGARGRYPAGVPTKVRRQIEHEFTLIEQLEYAPYFLTVHDIVRFARGRGILCQGRGAAANSAVCYCLGVTSVDPDRIDVLFERFVSRERNEPPDIDIDFEHERREEVIQYLYEKYGRDRAALTAVVITYRGRSAIRDVGKAIGLSVDAVDRLAKHIQRWALHVFGEDAEDGESLKAQGFNPRDPTIRLLAKCVREIVGFPRHLSQHVGGFVITDGPLCELVPIENAAMPDRTVIEWDKDDIDAMGMLKVDVLGLGMLTCIRKAFDLIAQHHGRRLTLATIPPEDPKVYDMICDADTLGVFQIESRAQMTMLPRLKPRCFYDLVIEVAIVRPGPIIGQMVHPYLRRRRGEEQPYYPDEKVRAVLEKTLGVPLFQEQAMALAIVAAGFTPGEAELLRRAITAWKSNKSVEMHARKFLTGMIRNGYAREFAEQCFQRLLGFSEYGFPESHSASFALLVYASSWLKCYYPAAFAAALLNSLPMGFYQPAQIVRDAREHGVDVLPVDVHHSDWDHTLAHAGRALRLGMRQVKGLRKKDARAIVATVRASGPFRSVAGLWRKSGVDASTLRTLASADAFGSMGLDRQHALWAVQALRGKALPLFDFADHDDTAGAAPLPPVPEPLDVGRDYGATGLSLKKHPMAFLRAQLDAERVLTARDVKDESQTPGGRWAAVAGIVLFRQRPGTAKGVVFMTLEDETARIDLIVRPHVFERFKTDALYSNVLLAEGRVEREGKVVHVLPTRLRDITHRLARLPSTSRDFH